MRFNWKQSPPVLPIFNNIPTMSSSLLKLGAQNKYKIECGRIRQSHGGPYSMGDIHLKGLAVQV